MGARALLDQLIAAGEDHQKAPQRAIGVPSLRPYLPRRRYLRRVLGGLAVLVRMGWKAAAPPGAKAKKKPAAPKDGEKTEEQPGFLDTLERAGAAALIVVIVVAAGAGVVSTLWAQAAPYARTVIGVALIALLTAAWIVGPHKPRTAEESLPEPQPDEPEMSYEEAVRIALIRFLDAHTRGRNGIHLSELHQKLLQTAAYESLSRAQLTPLLEANGVPLVRSLTVGGVSGRTGVRRADVEALLSPDT